MSDLLDVFKTGDYFATTTGITTWEGPAPIRLWQIGADGTPEEITKENTK